MTRATQLFWTFGSRLAVVALTAVFGVLSARILGPEDKGTYTLITLAPAITSTLAMLAGPQVVLMDVSNTGGLTRRVAALQRWSLATVVLASLVVTGYYIYFQNTPGVNAVVLLIAIVLGSVPIVVTEYSAALLQGLRQFRALALLRVAQVLLPGVSMLLGCFVGLIPAVLGFTLGGLLLGVVLLVFWIRQSRRIMPEEDDERRRIPWAFALITNLTLILLFMSYRVDVVVMGSISTSEEIGYYSAAVALAELVLLGSLSLTIVMTPSYAKDKDKPLGKGVLAVIGFSALAGAGIFVVAPWCVPLVFGEPYRPAVSSVQVLAIGIVFLAIYRFLVSIEIVRNFRSSALISASMILVADIVLLLILVPAHGALGAAIAASSAYALGALTIAIPIFVRSRKQRF